jgi:hypothetical protein
MNPKIKELALQAGGSHYPEVGGETLEKFAELVIRECAELFPMTFTDEQYQRRIDKTILKHFGLYQ